MTDDVKISDILRITSNNTHDLMIKIADHIDKQELRIANLEARIIELEGNND